MLYRLVEAPNFSPLVATHTASYDLYQHDDFIGRMSELRPELRLRVLTADNDGLTSC